MIDLNAIFVVILGIILLIRAWSMRNYTLINTNNSKVGFWTYFNESFSPTGFVKLLILIPIGKINKDISNYRLVGNFLTFVAYLLVIWIILYNVIL